MVNSILLFPGFANGKLFLPRDTASQEAVSSAVKEGLLIVFPGGRVGLSKKGRRRARDLKLKTQPFPEKFLSGY